ncbi:MAG: hypothetical protein IT489_08770 [Gammaproteobacteria bacterium]|nr:hypothetical protein [Gammaproteobacteria bacterium]
MVNRAAVKMMPKLYQAGGATLFLLVAGPTQALPVFDNWTVANGNVSVSCPAGFTCETLTTGDGFAQVQWVETATGDTFIQTIITDQGAGAGGGTPSSGLGYSDESFIMLGGSNGISSRQHYLQDDTATTGTIFENTTALNTGWAQTNPTSPDMDVTQTLTVDATPAVTGDEFTNAFEMHLIHDAGGTTTGSSITISQDSGLGNGVDTSTDAQKFQLVHLQGSYVATGSSITLDPTTTASGGTVAWGAGDDIMIRWIGQGIDLGAQGTAIFGFQGITNNTTDEEATTFSTTSAGITVDGSDPQGYGTPFDWDTIFGATPPQL